MTQNFQIDLNFLNKEMSLRSIEVFFDKKLEETNVMMIKSYFANLILKTSASNNFTTKEVAKIILSFFRFVNIYLLNILR